MPNIIKDVVISEGLITGALVLFMGLIGPMIWSVIED